MTYGTYEESRDSAAPVELFLFQYGSEDTSFIANTDAEVPVTLDGITYTPLPIKRGGIEAKGRPERADMTIETPLSAPIADLFRVYPPGRVVTAIIRAGNISEDGTPALWEGGANWPVIWTGRVLEGNRGGANAVLTCEAGSASMKRLGLRRNYQWSCPLALYGSRCRADKVAATTDTTVAVVGSNRIALTDGWMPQVDDPNYTADPDADPEAEPEPVPQVDRYSPSAFVGGLVKWNSPAGVEERGVLRYDVAEEDGDADEFVLTGPTPGLVPGDAVALSLGCPHTVEGCLGLHDNIVNYGGQPFIPTFNPLLKNNHT
jgi:hypothetical protein